MNRKQQVRTLAHRYAERRFGTYTEDGRLHASMSRGQVRQVIIAHGHAWIDAHDEMPWGVHKIGGLEVDFDRLRNDPAYPARHD